MSLQPMFDAQTLDLFSRSFLSMLLAASWKGFLLLTLAGLATLSLRRHSAAARHLLWTLSVVGLLALPLLRPLLPAVELQGLPDPIRPLPHVDETAVRNGGFSHPENAVLGFEALESNRSNERFLGEGIPGRLWTAHGGEATLFSARKAGSGPASLSGSNGPVASQIGLSWPWALLLDALEPLRSLPSSVWLFLVWELGALLALTYFLLGHLRLWRLTREACPIEDPAWLELSRQLGARLHLGRPVRLLRSDRSLTPMTWGVWRPVVLLPQSADAWSTAQRHDVLLHELAHVQRCDILSQMLAHAACVMFWFHPLAWLAAGRMRLERERACDDQVLMAGSRASTYASHLLEMARSLHDPTVMPLAGVAMARRSQLSERMMSLLDPQRLHRPASGWFRFASTMLALALVLPLSALRPAPPKEPAPPSPPHVVPAEASVPDVAAVPRSPSPPTDLRLSRASVSVGVLVAPPSVRVPYAIATGSASRVPSAAAIGADPRAPRVAAGSGVPRAVTGPRRFRAPTVASSGVAYSVAPFVGQWPMLAAKIEEDGRTIDVRRSKWQYNDGHERMKVEIEGKLRFNEDETDIEWMEEGARLRLEQKLDGERRRVVLDGNENGIERRYRENGHNRDFDEDAQKWFAEALQTFLWRSGINSEARIRRIYEKEGLDAVLDRIDTLEGDHARSQTYQALLSIEGFDEKERAKILEHFPSEIDSDFEKAQLLAATHDWFMDEPKLRTFYLHELATLDSDFEKGRVLKLLLSTGDELDADELSGVLAVAGDLDSDFEAANVLIELPRIALSEPQVQLSYLGVVGNLDSDFERGRVLLQLLDDRQLQDDSVVLALKLSEDMDSDFERGKILQQVLDQDLESPETRATFFASLDEMDSDFERSKVLQRLLQRRDLDHETIVSVLESADQIDSDFEKGKLLVRLAPLCAGDDELKKAYLRVADELDSEHEYGRAMRALRRAER